MAALNYFYTVPDGEAPVKTYRDKLYKNRKRLRIRIDKKIAGCFLIEKINARPAKGQKRLHTFSNLL